MLPVESNELELVFSKTYIPESHCMAFTSAVAKEGVSTMILSLAQRHIMAKRRVLVVDLNMINHRITAHYQSVPTPWEGFWIAGDEPVLKPDGEDGIAILPAPSDLNQMVKLREPGILNNAVNEWKKHYDLVLLDTPPLNNLNAGSISSPTICGASDSVVLVVLAGHTTDVMVDIAVKKLIEVDARLVGTVINDRDNPALRDELIREVNRIRSRLPRMAEWLHRRIMQSKILPLEV